MEAVLDWLGSLPGQVPEEIWKVLLAIAVGGFIGGEREYRDKSAGFRTMIFICVGAAVFTILSEKLAVAGNKDQTRIAANIVSGVGFLGAGVILRSGGRVVGLTTAAAIWLTAALGMGVGGGEYAFVVASTIIVLVVLWFFPWLERWIDVSRETRTYEVVCALSDKEFKRLESIFAECNLRVRSHKEMKKGEQMICVWSATGSIRNHDRLVARLFADPEVRELTF